MVTLPYAFVRVCACVCVRLESSSVQSKQCMCSGNDTKQHIPAE